MKKEYYPFEVACIDKALKNHDHYGVANYWTARPFTIFSRQKLKITEVFNNLSPFTYATNFVKVTSRNSYSFVIMNVTPIISIPNAIELNEENMININGTPQEKIICGSKKLLIYKNNSFKIPVFKTEHDSFYWPAAVLPSQFNSNIKSTERYVKASEGQGFVSFGPYVNLPLGKYVLKILYASNLSEKSQIGYWDISSNINQIENKYELFGTNNKYKEISHEIDVGLSNPKNQYEFRIYSYGKSSVHLKGIKLIRIN